MKPVGFFILYIVALHLAPILRLLDLLPFGRTAVLVDAASVISVVFAFLYVGESRKFGFSRLDLCVLAYVIVCVGSGIVYFQPNAPSEPVAFFYGIHYVLLPIFGFFAIKLFNKDERQLILKVIVGLILFSQAFGIYLYYARPDWYSMALEDVMLASQENDMTQDWRKFARMQSYTGSTSVGVFSAAALPALMLLKKASRLFILGLPLSIVSVLLSQQRGGLAATLFALMVLVVSDPKRIVIRLLSLACSIVILVLVLERFEDTHGGIMASIREKGFEMQYVYESRGYAPGFAYLIEWPLGVGLGATLSATDSAGLASRGQVVDANFMRIAADLGIQGLLIFGVMIAIAYKAAWNSTNRLASLSLISVFMIVCTGTNTLDMHLVSHCFWLFLGFIDADRADEARPNPTKRIPVAASAET